MTFYIFGPVMWMLSLAYVMSQYEERISNLDLGHKVISSLLIFVFAPAIAIAAIIETTIDWWGIDIDMGDKDDDDFKTS